MNTQLSQHNFFSENSGLWVQEQREIGLGSHSRVQRKKMTVWCSSSDGFIDSFQRCLCPKNSNIWGTECCWTWSSHVYQVVCDAVTFGNTGDWELHALSLHKSPHVLTKPRWRDPPRDQGKVWKTCLAAYSISIYSSILLRRTNFLWRVNVPNQKICDFQPSS